MNNPNNLAARAASKRVSEKAASCGEPSYVWRAGQQRRLDMILQASGACIHGAVLDNGCGIGMYVQHLQPVAGLVWGLEYDFDRAVEARRYTKNILNAAGEFLPFPDESFNVILSHEVLEHVQNDRTAAHEMARVLKPGGRLIVFLPNRGYPFETHGIFWRGRYRFGNIPLINYLPRSLRNRLAPHVRVYSGKDVQTLFSGLPLKVMQHTVVFGAYDNIIARRPGIGQFLRRFLQSLERTPLKTLGLSQFWVFEKTLKS